MNDNSKRNPTVVPAWPDDRFGEGSIVSKALNREGLDTLMQNAREGVKFLIKKSKTKTKTGGDQYFFEILPPFNPVSKPAATPLD